MTGMRGLRTQEEWTLGRTGSASSGRGQERATALEDRPSRATALGLPTPDLKLMWGKRAVKE